MSANRLFETYSHKSKEVKIIAEPKQVIENTTAVAVRSETDGWVSIYQPDAETDRFVLISPKHKRFACKFYNRNNDDFVGCSLLSIYNLREHFDRNIIPKEVGYNEY
ncbi:MAG: hypothetical protein ACI3T9_01155 [Romboutsia timonensis]